MPNIRSASVTARVISRMLKKAGFTMADTSVMQWTEGFHVKRWPNSNTVCVDYYTPNRLTQQEFIEVMQENIEKARTLLLEKGYEFEPKHFYGLYIKCEFP